MPFSDDFEIRAIVGQLESGNYHFCPGITKYEETFYNEIRYNAVHVRKWTVNERVDSDSCLLWHIPSKHVADEHKYTCDNCMKLVYQLNKLKKSELKVGHQNGEPA